MDELKEKIAEAIYGVLDPALEWNEESTRIRALKRFEAAAALRAIEEAGFAVVPKEPTSTMLQAAKPFPYALCQERGDVEYTKRMEAATLSERMAVVSMWRDMLAAARPLNLEEPRG